MSLNPGEDKFMTKKNNYCNLLFSIFDVRLENREGEINDFC